jgi:mannose-6-phosphate isomerase-like protein (cupin superfamily)
MPTMSNTAHSPTPTAAASAPASSSAVRAPHYQVADFATIPGVLCPCGVARRAFADVSEFPGTIHVTEIHADARTHYHRKLTETYYVLECEPGARLELDGDVVPVRVGSCVVIPPGTRHRAVGRMRILNIVLPKFDPADEWFD